jgi:peptide deformylase
MRIYTLPLTLYPSETLKTPGEKIPRNEIASLKALREDMIETMYKERGVGLAAQQIGKTLQMCVIDVDGTVYTLFNPKITSSSQQMHTDEEGCLSVPGKFFPIERHWKVTVRYLDENGLQQKMRASGLLARAIQHEVDHLNGILILDRLYGQQKRS